MRERTCPAMTSCSTGPSTGERICTSPPLHTRSTTMAIATATFSPPQVHRMRRVSARLARRTSAHTCFGSDGGGVKYKTLVRSAVRNARWASYACAHAGHACKCCVSALLLTTSSSSSRYPWSKSCVSSQSTFGLRVQMRGHVLLQPRASARQARHHRPQRQIRDVRNVFVRQPFQVTHDDNFSERHWQVFQCLSQQLLLCVVQEECFGIHIGTCNVMERLVKLFR